MFLEHMLQQFFNVFCVRNLFPNIRVGFRAKETVKSKFMFSVGSVVFFYFFIDEVVIFFQKFSKFLYFFKGLRFIFRKEAFQANNLLFVG